VKLGVDHILLCKYPIPENKFGMFLKCKRTRSIVTQIIEEAGLYKKKEFGLRIVYLDNYMNLIANESDASGIGVILSPYVDVGNMF